MSPTFLTKIPQPKRVITRFPSTHNAESMAIDKIREAPSQTTTLCKTARHPEKKPPEINP